MLAFVGGVCMTVARMPMVGMAVRFLGLVLVLEQRVQGQRGTCKQERGGAKARDRTNGHSAREARPVLQSDQQKKISEKYANRR